MKLLRFAQAFGKTIEPSVCRLVRVTDLDAFCQQEWYDYRDHIEFILHPDPAPVEYQNPVTLRNIPVVVDPDLQAGEYLVVVADLILDAVGDVLQRLPTREFREVTVLESLWSRLHVLVHRETVGTPTDHAV